MKTSTALEWCFHAAILIEQATPGSSVTRQQIATYHGIPESYLAKHLKSLVHHGILRAVTGPNGGYQLNRSAAEITALDIFEAVEGPAPAFRCAEIRAQGTGAASPAECAKVCSVNSLMLSSEQAFRRRLAQTTVADLVDSIPEGIKARNRRTLDEGRKR